MRNAEATRELILNAAMDEFSAFGIAGARVERIAKNAGCNKNLIYVYFENKETLFNTVLQKHRDRAFEDIPFTPNDLPGYAVSVFNFAMTHPQLMRLMMWSNLEHQAVNSSQRETLHEQKVQAISNAQSSGHVGSTMLPGILLTYVMTLATAWTATNPFGPSLEPEALKNVEVLKESIIRAVTLMTETKRAKD
ncbi:TetR/AcrR family transcriptional regulator [Paenibacillus pedocola]|uniref:TetR/AcrR family transcriptional regulator n=1 Tax=Paenibacillus pedocola TaxID=3242193 RepID=UPI00287794A2|nr:TetR family transcriptional regulator [Paenibacillus typhae]